MCFPCWPLTAVYVEEDKKNKKYKNKGKAPNLYYDPKLRMWVQMPRHHHMLPPLQHIPIANMATACNTPAPEQNFQPQVPDTSNGPNLHTYIRRDDTSVFINGVIYTCVPTAAAAVPVPITPIPMAVPMQQYCMPQAAATAYQPFSQQAYMYPAMQAQHPAAINMTMPMPGPYPPYIQPPFGTVGFTPNEMMAANAQNPQLAEPQDIKPGDSDPFRMYMVREPDGTFVARNRKTIDSGDIGDCRWYQANGVFYAVRLG